MSKPHWDRFEWDDENKKGGNVQHLRDHGIEPEETKNVSSMTTCSLGTIVGLMTYTSLMVRRIEAGNCDWLSRTKAGDSREYSPAGN